MVIPRFHQHRGAEMPCIEANKGIRRGEEEKNTKRGKRRGLLFTFAFVQRILQPRRTEVNSLRRVSSQASRTPSLCSASIAQQKGALYPCWDNFAKPSAAIFFSSSSILASILPYSPAGVKPTILSICWRQPSRVRMWVSSGALGKVSLCAWTFLACGRATFARQHLSKQTCSSSVQLYHGQ